MTELADLGFTPSSCTCLMLKKAVRRPSAVFHCDRKRSRNLVFEIVFNDSIYFSIYLHHHVVICGVDMCKFPLKSNPSTIDS